MLPRMRRLAKPCALVLLAAAALAGPLSIALADVDPASDVLLLQNVFVPYHPKVCSELKDQLRSLTDKARGAGFPVKVALIGSKDDLGGAPQFYGDPPGYAKFLGQELGVFGPDVGKNLNATPLMVVMPQGFGTYQVDKNAAAAAKTVSVPRKDDPNALARAVILALPKVATAAGHKLDSVKPASGCSKGGTSFLVYLAPIALLLAAGVLLRYGLRPRRSPEPASPGAGRET
jgi:hypothetical protein